MAELGAGGGSDYPGAIDTDAALEVDNVDDARADVPNDLAEAIVKIETELGVDPAGVSADLATRLGNVLAVEFAQLENINATAISAARWAIVGALTTHPIGADGIAGRILRALRLDIENGSVANTLKCTVFNIWNGDAFGPTDNVAKGVLTGHFTLSADGKTLTIEAAGLTGNAVYASGYIYANLSGAVLLPLIGPAANDIYIVLRVANTPQDMTVLVDTGGIYLQILYITSA